MFGDSNMSGLSLMSEVDDDDMRRWTGYDTPDTTYPLTPGASTADFPIDIQVPDVLVLQPNMPWTGYDERSITAAGAGNSSLTLSGATLAANKRDAWVFIAKNSTGYGNMVRITSDPSAGWPVTISDPFVGSYPIVAGGLARVVDGSHTITGTPTSDANNDTTTITKTGLTADFAVEAGDWVVIAVTGLATLTAWHLARKVVSRTATTVTVSPRLTALPAAGDCIVEMLGANAVKNFDDLATTDNFAFRSLRLAGLGQGCFLAPSDCSTYLSLTFPSPYQHLTNARINGVPEATWWIKSFVDGPLYVVLEGMGGATAVTQPVADTVFRINDLRYSYQTEIDYNDFRPGPTNGLYAIITRKLDAAKQLALDVGDTLNVVGILSNVGTNDAAWSSRASGYEEAMGHVIDRLRAYVFEHEMTEFARAEYIPFGLTTVNSSLADRPYKDTVNEAMTALAAAKTAVFVVDATDFELMTGVESVHLSAAGQIAWGKAFYEGWFPVYKEFVDLAANPEVPDATGDAALDEALADAPDVASYTTPDGLQVNRRSVDELIKLEQYQQQKANRARGLSRTRTRFMQ